MSVFSRSRSMVILFSVLVLMSVVAQTPMVYGVPPPLPLLNYALTLSTNRIQESNTPGLTMTLNVSNTMSGSFYGFSWNVTDPSGGKGSYVYYVAANGPTLILAAVYPRDFSGGSVRYNGTYLVNAYQTYPAPTALVATSKFYAGLTDSLSYQRTAQVSILAQGYAPNENVTVRIVHAGIQASGFPISPSANGNGVFSHIWSIPVSASLGDYNVSLLGQVTVKKPSDSQIFTILPTSVSVSQLVVNVTALQGSQIAFSFAAVYPDGNRAKTGMITLRVVEPDGVISHLINMTYNTATNTFDGTYRISATGPLGGWVTIIDANSFNDGYGNVGPSTSAVKGFVVAHVDSQNLPTSQNSTITYLLLIAVVLMAIALTVLVSWVSFFGKKKVQRSVLKVDLQSIEKEALRVQNRDFFVKVRDQLTHRQQAKPEEATKNG